jgi:HAD superfamily hydrolase (TIGR01549 family)
MAGVRNPVDPDGRILAVLFDLDGTLYHQGRLRALMAMEMASLPLYRPLAAWREMATVSAYRRALERLRRTELAVPLTPTHQVQTTSRDTGVPDDIVQSIAAEWMISRPLKYLRWCQASGLRDLLAFLDGRGLRVGVFSDYPVEAKLAALGLAARFSPVLCATDPEIGALKPHPRGFLQACRVWQLPPQEVLMVGDRLDLDAAGAAAADMPCVIVRRRPTRAYVPPHCLVLPSLERLRHALDDRR